MLHLDFETRSECDLIKAGAYAYFEHPSTRILCAGYCFGDEAPQIWWPGDPFYELMPVIEHIESGGKIAAWNAAFERLAWRHSMVPHHGLPSVADRQWQCTMTEALAMNLPGKLARAAPALGLDTVKDDTGYRLMMKMCKPRKPRKDEPKDAVLWHEALADIRRLGEYCIQDVVVEREISKRILRLRPLEEEIYLLDMKINDQGVHIDRQLCKAAQRIVEQSTERFDAEIKRVTHDGVASCTNTRQLLTWLDSRGIAADKVDRENVEDLLILDIPNDVRRALELRQEGNKTSTAKITSMLLRTQADGRMRGNLQMNGASATCRWAARGTQLQNLTRPVILGSKDMEPLALDAQIDGAIASINKGSSVMIELIYGQPLTLVADTVRSLIDVASGNVLRSSDFSNIEGRGVAWEAGQEDKLDAFRAFDNGTGPDLYLVAASGIFSIPISEAKPQRQIGKVAELSLGYQGGPRAFAKMAKNYGVRIAKHYDGIWEMADNAFKDKALEAWDTRGRKTGMTREGWLASEVIKLAWRARNWRIAEYWKEVEDAAILAVKEPGRIVQAGKVRFLKVKSFLFCQLPSGRAMSYPYPQLREVETPWGGTREQLFYKSQYLGQWITKAYYGGLGVENITQAIARDIMAEAMLRVDAAGYNVVLTVHDEIITEDPEGFGSLDEFNELMSTMPAWAAGFPISVGGWQGKRYRKA